MFVSWHRRRSVYSSSGNAVVVGTIPMADVGRGALPLATPCYAMLRVSMASQQCWELSGGRRWSVALHVVPASLRVAMNSCFLPLLDVN